MTGRPLTGEELARIRGLDEVLAWQDRLYDPAAVRRAEEIAYGAECAETEGDIDAGEQA